MKYLSIIFLLLFAFAIQSNAQCSVTLSTYDIFVGHNSNYADQENGTLIDITAPADCAWTATTSADWISFASFSRVSTVSGTGSRSVRIYVPLNEGNPRSGTVTVNDKTINVQQSSGCRYIYAGNNAVQNFHPEGGARNYPLLNSRGSGNCSGTYTTSDSWIHPGATSYTIDRSEGVARTGQVTYHYGNNLTVSFTVNQAAGCFYSISQPETSLSAGGGAGTLALQTGSACQWRAEANQDWITVTNSSGAGTGTGTVTYSVAPNTGAARTGIINIAGQILTVNQAGAKSRKRVRFF